MNRHASWIRLTVLCCLICSPAFGQVAGKTYEPGVFHGMLYNESPLLVAIDETQKIGYASLRAELVCNEAVKVFVGSGNASLESPLSVTSTIDARCPDKSVISLDIRMVYDLVTDTMELSFPGFPAIPPATLGRIDFDPSVFTSAIQEMKNESTWVVMNLFANYENRVTSLSTVEVVGPEGIPSFNGGFCQSTADCTNKVLVGCSANFAWISNTASLRHFDTEKNGNICRATGIVTDVTAGGDIFLPSPCGIRAKAICLEVN